MTPGTEVDRAQFTTEELAVVVDEAHASDLPVTAHAHALSAIRNAVAAGVDGIEHFTFLTAHGLHMPEDVLAAVAAQGIVVCPTLGRVPGTVPPPQLLDRLQKAGLDFDGLAAQLVHAHRAGVTVVSGTDGGINPAKAHGNLPRSVMALASGSMAPADALATATSLAADACGLGDHKGRIRPGYDADLLVVDGDPLADVGALLRLDTTILAGVVLAS